MYSRCIIDVFSPIDLDVYLFVCFSSQVSSFFTVIKQDWQCFSLKWAWQENKLGHFCQGALIIDGVLGPLWAILAVFGHFGQCSFQKYFCQGSLIVYGNWAILGNYVSFWVIFKRIFAKDHLSSMVMPLFQKRSQVVQLEFDSGCFGSDSAQALIFALVELQNIEKYNFVHCYCPNIGSDHK